MLHVSIPLTTDTAQAFGWKQQARSSSTTTTAGAGTGATTEDAAASSKIPSSSCAVLLTVPPHCPRSILDQIMLIWMEDLGFSHVGFCTAQIAATYAPPQPMTTTTTTTTTTACSAIPTPLPTVRNVQCIVDLGWSACTVVPTYRHRATDVRSIRRLPLGGRHLINMLQYYCSYRQWNLMDQEWILRQVLEKTGYVSLAFDDEMKLARQITAGKRPFDREFLLPDYQTSFQGQVQLPPSLQKQMLLEHEKGGEGNNDESDDDEEDEDDESVREEDMNEEDIEFDVNEEVEPEPVPEKKKKKGPQKKSKQSKSKRGDGKKDKKDENNKNEENDDDDDDDDNDNDDDDEETDSDEEDVDALRKRLLLQREEEERRRRAMEAERQALRLSVERFTIPEILFRPSDGGLPREWAGLAGTIVQAIEKSPEHFRAALYQSIRLVGGLSQLPNLKERLEQELRPLVPCEYEVRISLSESPQEDTWRGLQAMASILPYSDWSINKEEWTNLSKRGSWGRLTHAEGGALV